MKEGTLVVLNIMEQHKDTLKKSEDLCKIMWEFFGQDLVVIVDNSAYLKESNPYFFKIFVQSSRIRTTPRILDIDAATRFNFKRAIIVTDKNTSIRSIYYDILGLKVPSHSVKVYIVDEDEKNA